MLVFGHFWSLKTISRRSENHKFSRGRFFLFGPGRARREQPNAGLHLGVRAFVRSVSHVKVFLLVYFLFFWEFASHIGHDLIAYCTKSAGTVVLSSAHAEIIGLSEACRHLSHGHATSSRTSVSSWTRR